MRCLPLGTTSSGTFADESCSERVFAGSNTAAPPKFINLGGSQPVLYRVGNQRTVSSLYYVNGGGDAGPCRKPSDYPTGLVVNDLVGPEPMTTFALFEAHVE